MKRNKTLTALLLLVLPLFLTACTLQDLPLIGQYFGGNGGSKAAALTMWGLWEAPTVVENLISKYNEANPNVTVTYEDRSVVKPGQYRDTIINRIDQGDAADVILVHNTWVPFMSDKLEPMPSSVMDADTYKSTFYPVASASAVNSDGKIYAVPMYHDGLVLVYNKDHFDEIDQLTPPTAWEEFRRLATELSRYDDDGNLIRGGAAIGNHTNVDFFSDILGLMFAQAGVSIPDGLDSRAAQDALSFYTDFVKEAKVWNDTFPEASSSFAAGDVSMIFVPSWNLLDILAARPDMNIGVAAVPQAVPENPASWGSFWMYAVPTSSSNKEAAWEFIKYISSDEQQLAAFNDATQYRTYGAPYSSSSLADQVSVGASGEYLKPLLDSAPYAKSSIMAARSGNDIVTEAMKTAINAIFATKQSERLTPSEALSAAKATINSSN